MPMLIAVLISSSAMAALTPSQRHEAGPNKTGRYISEGFFAGGQKTVTSARLKDIRRAQSHGFERIVLDLEPQADDGGAVPYFQVQASPNESRLVVSIWADVMYDFDAGKVGKAFRKSAHVRRLNVIPRVEEGLAVLEFVLNSPKGGKKPRFEAFRLSQPTRIIVDIQ